MKKAIISIFLLLMLIGCSEQNEKISRPDDVRQEVWNTALTYSIIINEFTKEKIHYENGSLAEKIGIFCNPDNLSSYSTTEMNIFNKLKNMATNSVSYILIGGESSKQDYLQSFNEMGSLFGNDAIKIENIKDQELWDQIFEEYSTNLEKEIRGGQK